MDIKSVRNTLHADDSISVIDRFVIVAIADGMYHPGSKYRVSICELASQCNVSTRTVKKSIANLKRAGIVTISTDASCNVYELHGEMIPRKDTGARNSPAGARNSPVGGARNSPAGARNSPAGARNSPAGGVYKGLEVLEVKEVCENTRGRGCARAHARARNFDELTESDAIAAGESAGVSADMARQVFADMKANGGGYMNRNGVFVKVTSENLQAAIRAMGKRAQSEPQAAMPKPKAHRAEDVATAKALCSERCAMFKAGKCGAGVAVLPYLSEHPHPPEECKHFKPLRK